MVRRETGGATPNRWKGRHETGEEVAQLRGSARQRNIDDARIFRDLTLLFYPSVLGSIIYKFLELTAAPGPITSGQILSLMLLFSIICHYSVDYLYTLYFKNYNFASFILDLVIVSLMFYAASVVTFDEGASNMRHVAFAFTATYGLFVAIDFLTLELSADSLKVIIPEAVVALYFLVLAIVGSEVSILMMTCSILIASTILFYIAPKPEKPRAQRGSRKVI